MTTTMTTIINTEEIKSTEEWAKNMQELTKIDTYVMKIRELEAQMLKLIESGPLEADGRWKSIAKTHFQEGRMALVRSVKKDD